MSYHLMFYTLGEASVTIFHSIVFATPVPGANHRNYYHSSQTLGCELRDFDAFEVFQKGPCYSFPTLHCNNQNVVEPGYVKLQLKH